MQGLRRGPLKAPRQGRAFGGFVDFLVWSLGLGLRLASETRQSLEVPAIAGVLIAAACGRARLLDVASHLLKVGEHEPALLTRVFRGAPSGCV